MTPVTRATLDNGLRVLVAQNHNAPLVSLRALVRSGADHDVPELAGLASFLPIEAVDGPGPVFLQQTR